MSVSEALHAYVAEEIDYSDGEVIIEEGSRGEWVYVILEGSAKVKKRTSKRMVTVDVLGEGEVIGEVAFLEGGKAPRSASVVAAEGPVRVGLLDTEKLLSDYAGVAPELKPMIRSLIKKLRDTTSKVCSMVVSIE
ncbi:MAG: cyclic nucleotide-binding domain-containing protein [Deltaproteobacteria bacterium]